MAVELVSGFTSRNHGKQLMDGGACSICTVQASHRVRIALDFLGERLCTGCFRHDVSERLVWRLCVYLASFDFRRISSCRVGDDDHRDRTANQMELSLGGDSVLGMLPQLFLAVSALEFGIRVGISLRFYWSTSFSIVRPAMVCR